MRSDCPYADAIPMKAKREHDDERDARRNRRALEVFDFAGGVGKLGCGDVIARQTADAGNYKKEEEGHVPAAAHAEPVRECCGRDAEAHDVRQRVELAPSKGRLMRSRRTLAVAP